MEFHVKSGNPEKQRTACVVVGIFEARRLSSDAARLDEATDGLLSLLVRRGDIDGKPRDRLNRNSKDKNTEETNTDLVVPLPAEGKRRNHPSTAGVRQLLTRPQDCGSTDGKPQLEAGSSPMIIQDGAHFGHLAMLM
jgi:hypothetical protein